MLGKRRPTRRLNGILCLQFPIQKGRYFEIWRSVNAQGVPVALKLLSPKLPSEEQITHIENLNSELALLRTLSHPNIITLKGYSGSSSWLRGNDEVLQTPALVLELGDFDIMELLTFSGRLSEDVARTITASLLSAVAYMHKVGLAHLDLKPEQLVVVGSTVKLIDFGTGTRSHVMDRAVGTHGYAAPEIINLMGEGKVNICAADIWSIGVTVFTLICGFPPFHYASNKDALYQAFTTDRAKYWGFVQARGLKVSMGAQDFMESLLETSVDDRLNCQQAISHQWIDAPSQNKLTGKKDFKDLVEKFRCYRKMGEQQHTRQSFIYLNRSLLSNKRPLPSLGPSDRGIPARRSRRRLLRRRRGVMKSL